VELYILQHGHAVSREENSERPLSDSGRRDIDRLAKCLANKDVHIQHIFHSNKLRAEQSALIVSEGPGGNVSPEYLSGISPKDSPEAFIDTLDMSTGNILLVSHMPFVSRLCSVLLTGSSSTGFNFTPGTLVCLNFENDEWSMTSMMRPEDN
jgi:phosphohistidine phosphatase